MTNESTVSAILVPGEWIVHQEGDVYIIYWHPFDGEPQYRGSADTLELAQWWVRLFLDDMLARIGSMEKSEPKMKKNGVEKVKCPGPGQVSLFPKSSRSS